MSEVSRLPSGSSATTPERGGRSRAAVAYRVRGPGGDWLTFSLFAAAAAILCVALGAAMTRDERAAARARAEHVVRTLALRLADTASRPGADFSSTLPTLAAALGSAATLAVIDDRPTGGDESETPRVLGPRYVGHSDPARALQPLDLSRPADVDAWELVQLVRRRSAEGTQMIVRWVDGRAEAIALGPSQTGVVAFARGVEPPPTQGRGVRTALLAFVLLLVFSAGLHDVLRGVGKFLNLIALALTAVLVVLVGDAFQPGLWRGDVSVPIWRAATDLHLADLARQMAVDLPAGVSSVREYGPAVGFIAVSVYVLALLGTWSRVGRRLARHRWPLLGIGPLIVLGIAAGALPAALGIGMALTSTPTPSGGSAPPPVIELLAGGIEPWLLLVAAAGSGAASLLVQGGVALVGTFLLPRRVPGRRAWLSLAAVPWVLPAAFVGLAGRHVSGGIDPFVLHLLLSAWTGTPLLLLVFDAARSRVSREVVEVAHLSGASGWQVLREVEWPAMRPVAGLAFVIAACATLESTTLGVLGAGPGAPVAGAEALRWAIERTEYGRAAAWSLIGLLPLLALLVTAVALDRSRRSAVRGAEAIAWGGDPEVQP